MTVKEFNEFLDEMKDKGYTNQMILVVLYSMYANNEFTTQEYENLINVMGYEFSDEFRNMSEEEKHKQGITWEDDEETETKTETKKDDSSDEETDKKDFEHTRKYFGN